MSESTDTSSPAMRYVATFLRFLVHCWAGICLFLLISQSGLLEATGLGPDSASLRPAIGLLGPLVGGFALSVTVARQIDRIERPRLRILALGLGLPVGYAAVWLGTVTVVLTEGSGAQALRAASSANDSTAVHVETGRWPIPAGSAIRFDQETLDRLEVRYQQQLPERMLSQIRTSWPEGPRHEITVMRSYATYIDLADRTRLAVVRMILQVRADDRTVLMIHAGVVTEVGSQEFVQVICSGGPSLSIFRQPCRNSVERIFGIDSPSVWTPPPEWPF